jgi:hypothetical protein
VAIAADAEKLEVDAASGSIFFLVVAAKCFGVRRHVIGDVDVCPVDVYMPEEILVH